MAEVLFNTETLRYPVTGIGRYVLGLGTALRAGAATPAVVFHPRPPAWPGDAPPAAPVSGRAAAAYRLRRTLRGVPGVPAAAAWWRDRRFCHGLPRPLPALYHEPNYIPRPFPGATVVTCHDLSHLRYPALHPRDRLAYLARRLPPALDRAARIIVPSAFVATELQDLLDVPAGRIRVVPEGVEGAFHPRPAAALRPVLDPLGLAPGGYVLSVGTREPRKNLAALAEGFARLPAGLRRAFPLVVVGVRGWGDGPIDRALAPLQREGSAVVAGYVPEATLQALYAGAAVFAYLSAYEGFGLPCLEAMASGAPVLASPAPALAEVTGPAARRVTPEDADAVAAALAELLESPGARTALAEAGPARAAGFTWPRAAAATRAIYAEVLAETGDAGGSRAA